MNEIEIIDWLRSYDGQMWALGRARYDGNASRHESGIFGSLKPDIEFGDSWATSGVAFGMTFPRMRGKA